MYFGLSHNIKHLVIVFGQFAQKLFTNPVIHNVLLIIPVGIFRHTVMAISLSVSKGASWDLGTMCNRV